MSETPPPVEKLQKQLRMLKKKLERSEWHRVDLENQHDRDQHLYRRLQADLEAARREAEIEAALERTRAQSLAMQHSSELVATSAVFHEQLLALGVPTEFSYVWLPNEPAGKHQFWATWTEEEDGEPIHRSKAITYDLDKEEPYTAACFAAWESDERFLVDLVPLAEVAHFFEIWGELIGSAEHLRPELFPDGIYYAEGYMAYGCFGINIRREPSEEERGILRRFAAEFERAYTRFLDLRRAEAQAREAEIEAALEKVRSRSLAVASTDEFGDVVTVVFEKLSELGIPAYSVTMPLLKEDTDAWDVYGCGVSDEGLTTLNFKLPYFSNPITDDILDAKSRSESGYLSTVYTPEEKDLYYDYALTQTELRNLPDDVKETIRQRTPYAVCAAYAKSSIIIANDFEGNELTEAQADVLKRFSRVFDQAYTRFLDLQRAEAQAREAEIEAAMERVRSRALAMTTSNELLDVVFAIRQQFAGLGLECGAFWHTRYTPEVYQKALTSLDGKKLAAVMELPRDFASNPDLAAWEHGDEPVGVFAFDAEAGAAYMHHMATKGKFSEIDPEAVTVEMVREHGGITFVQARTSHGEIGYSLWGEAEPSEEAKDVLVRFATAFDLAYRRFEDLQKAEAKARETQIEAALERVRSTALAMTTPNDLLDVIQKIHQEYVGLGLPGEVFWHTRYTPESYHKAVTSVGGEKVSAIMELPRDFSMVPELAAWERGDERVGVFQFDPEAAASYVHHMNTKGQFHRVDPEGITPEIARELGGLTFVQARTSHGEIGFALWGEAEPSEEAKDVLVRFATTFDLAYRRFLDLQQVEADHQALLEEKALTEQALVELRATQAQLVHAEKMASLGALTAGIAHEIKNPLNFVTGFASLLCDLVDDLDAETDPDEVQAILSDLKLNAKKIEEHGQRADAIVRSMMQHAREGSGERKAVDLNALVREHVELAYHGKRAQVPDFTVEIEQDLGANVERVEVVPQEIGRVVLNLVGNAFDAVRERAAEVNGQYAPRVTVTTRRLNDRVEIRVADNGTGIPDAVRDRIFEPFFTTKPTGEGTGLGLSLSFDIVTQGHGGTLAVESDDGRGATFTLVLPASPL